MINATTNNSDPKKMTDEKPLGSEVKKEELVSFDKSSDPSKTSAFTPPPSVTPSRPTGFDTKPTRSDAKMSSGSSSATTAPTTPPGSDQKPYKPKKKFNIKMIAGVFVLLLIVLGSGAGFYLSQQTQDLRQQAYVGSPCGDNKDCDAGERCASNGLCEIDPTGTLGLPCDGPEDCTAPQTCPPGPTPVCTLGGGEGDDCDLGTNDCSGNLVCHCQDGNACNTHACEKPSTTKNPCIASNRAWCVNEGGEAYTCCAEGYVCKSGGPGCVPGTPATTPPATTEPPETTPPSTTPPATTPPATTPPAGEPICRDLAILDENNNVIDPNNTTFSIGMKLKFRCAADDPNDLITKYQFKITKPNGNITQGAAINPAGKSAISQIFQINLFLDHLVQCRACTASGCQTYKTITN